MKRGVGPDYFADAARRCLEKAKRAFSPETKAILTRRAAALRQTAMEFARSMAIRERIMPLNAEASTLEDLKAQLGDLAPGESMQMPASAYVKLFGASSKPNNFGSQTHLLMMEYDCAIQFRPDGLVWFIKN